MVATARQAEAVSGCGARVHFKKPLWSRPADRMASTPSGCSTVWRELSDEASTARREPWGSGRAASFSTHAARKLFNSLGESSSGAAPRRIATFLAAHQE
jgi:hypothetical protein